MTDPATHGVSDRTFLNRSGSDRPHVAWLLTPIVILVIVSYVGDALAPQWFDRHPAWLLSLNARSRNLALATPHIDTFPYYAVGAARLLLSDPLFYLLGFWYGENAIAWMERRTPSIGEFMRNSEGWFSKLGYPMVFFAPNNPVCLLAGASGMSPIGFVVTNFVGTFTRLFLIRRAGEEFESPLGAVSDFIGQYRLPLTVMAVLWAAWSLRNEFAKGKANEASLADLAKLDDAPEGTDEPPDAARTENAAEASGISGPGDMSGPGDNTGTGGIDSNTDAGDEP